MADITMCNNENCKYSKNCYRFNAVANLYYQAYFTNSKEACENNDYHFYYKMRKR